MLFPSEARGVLSIFPVVSTPQNQEPWIGFRKEFQIEGKSGFQWSYFNTDIKYESEERKRGLKKWGVRHTYNVSVSLLGKETHCPAFIIVTHRILLHLKPLSLAVS